MSKQDVDKYVGRYFPFGIADFFGGSAAHYLSDHGELTFGPDSLLEDWRCPKCAQFNPQGQAADDPRGEQGKEFVP